MLDPEKLFPKALGLEWGCTQEQCRSALTVPVLDQNARFVTVEIQVDGKSDSLSL
jgi:hypothetical protein